MKTFINLIFITIVLFFNSVFSQSIDKTDFQKYLYTWRKDNNVPGVIVEIKTPNTQAVYASGSKDLSKNQPVNTETLFGVGSITKTIISAMILKLEADRKLNINDPIGKYFPQYPRWKNITIKQLLNMTSGISNYMNDAQYKADLNKNYQQEWGSDKLINLAYYHTDDFEPGKSWNYTNTDYLLLGKIIEKITQKPLGEVLQNKFFNPLSMQHTYYQEDTYSPYIFNQLASGYYNNVIIKPSLPHNLGAAAGGIVMSVNDLATWTDHLFIKKDILPQKQLEEMLTGVPIPPGKIKPANSLYGLGVTITNNKMPNEYIWYTGVTPYHTAIYLWIPSSNKMIIGLSSFNRHGDKNYDLLFPEKPLLTYLRED